MKREGNLVADNLARVMPNGVEQVWLRICRSQVLSFVLVDSLALE